MSWIIVSRATGKPVLETFSSRTADALSMGLDDSPVSGSLIEARKALRNAGVL
jgi:hypothetical protein